MNFHCRRETRASSFHAFQISRKRDCVFESNFFERVHTQRSTPALPPCANMPADHQPRSLWRVQLRPRQKHVNQNLACHRNFTMIRSRTTLDSDEEIIRFSSRCNSCRPFLPTPMTIATSAIKSTESPMLFIYSTVNPRTDAPSRPLISALSRSKVPVTALPSSRPIA